MDLHGPLGCSPSISIFDDNLGCHLIIAVSRYVVCLLKGTRVHLAFGDSCFWFGPVNRDKLLVSPSLWVCVWV